MQRFSSLLEHAEPEPEPLTRLNAAASRTGLAVATDLRPKQECEGPFSLSEVSFFERLTIAYALLWFAPVMVSTQ